MRLALVIPGFQADTDDWCIPAFTNLSRELSRKVELHVFTLRYPNLRRDYDIGRVHVHALGGGAFGATRLPVASLLKLWNVTLRAFEAEHRRAPFSCIVGIWATESGWLATLIGRRLKIPSLVHLAGGELTWLPDIRYGNQGRGLSRLLVRQTLRRAGILTVPSTLMRLALSRVAEVPEGRVRCLPLGVDTALFAPRAGANLLAPDIPFTFITVGSLIPVKGYDWLIDGLARLVHDVPEAGFRWLVVGAGPLRSRLAASVQAAGLGSKVEFLGEIRHERLPELYRTMDCFLLGSRHEAQCMAALEAMACGLPWIAPPVGALADCAEPDAGGASRGFVVAERSADALAGAIKRMLTLPPAARQAMGRAARERVERDYALDLQVEGLLSLIEELTHSGPLDRIAHTKL